MGSNRWNHSGCCGQYAGCNNCGNTGCDTAADCCDTCGLNTATLDISATGNGSCQHDSCGCSCGNTGCDTAADCCDTCGLTINPDGGSIAGNQGGYRPSRPVRPGSCGCGGRVRCSGAKRSEYSERSCSECSEYNDRPCSECNECGGGNQGNIVRESGCCGDCGQVTRRSGCRGKCHSAMVFHEEQALNELFTAEEALQQGTLFPELAKPLAAVKDCQKENCATRRQQMAFAAWELRLYLNMHPDDQRALAMWKKLCCEADEDNYATAFTGCCGQDECWKWVQSPWPWEMQPCCGKKNHNR